MKVSKLKKFDAAEHLRTPEARAEYLSIVIGAYVYVVRKN
jgi:DNA-binding phage protein